MHPGIAGRTEAHCLALAKLDPKGQKRVSEFNLITWEGPAEPVRPFIHFTVCETKENGSSGTRIMENLNDIPAVVPVFKKGAVASNSPHLHLTL